MAFENSAYAILGISKGADDKEVKAAYVNLVKKYDPEKHTDRFMVIQQAYDRLRVPKTRAKEDVYTYNLAGGEYLFNENEKWNGEGSPDEARIAKLRAEYLEDPLNDQKKKAFCSELFRRAHWLTRRKRFSDAVRDWGEILEHDPSNARARHNLELACSSLGISYALHGLYEEAVDLLERALKLNPDNTSQMHNLALIAEKMKDVDRTFDYWEAVIARWKARLSQEPDDEYRRFLILEALNHQAELTDLGWGRARTPKQQDQRTSGTTQKKEWKITEPAESEDRKSTARPTDSKASVPTPQVNEVSSLDRYREIVELNPDDFDTHFHLCNKLMEEQLWQDAITELEKLVKKHPKNTEVWNLMGWAYLNCGKKDQAFNAWKRSMAIDSKNPQTREHLVKAHLMMGKAFRKKGIFTQALVHFKQLLTLMPKSAEVHLEIAATYDMKGDVRSAAHEYNQVLQLDPKNKIARKALNDLRMKR